MAKKFVIANNKLIIGNVECHFELFNSDTNAIVGGGYWHIDVTEKRIYLYGSSIDFGPINETDLKNCKVHFRWDGFEIWFSHIDNLEEVLKMSDQENNFKIKKL